MLNKTVGFIGGGRITRIILEGWKRAQKLPAQISVSDPNPEALARLKKTFPSICADSDITRPSSADIVFLAVHPPAMGDAAKSIQSHLQPHSLAISLAPKFTIAKLSALLGGFTRIARVIPNAPSIIGAGFNPVAFASSLRAADRADLTDLLRPLGEHPEVSEEKLEAYAILSAMGPTYFWFQLQTLREVVSSFGLTDAEITPALKRMSCGATRTLLESGVSPAEVIDLIPVKPLAEMEQQVVDSYRTRLPAIYQKIKPA